MVSATITENSMLIYHGSNVEIQKPEIRQRRTMDFGHGFYTTLNENQARDFAPKVVLREQKLGNKAGVATINIYEFDRDLAEKSAKIRHFESANGEWLDYVVNNRQGIGPVNDYDIIIGPVANDDVYAVVDYYIDGAYTREIALSALKIKSLYDQVVLKTNTALGFLKFHSSYRV
jgi:hypothetical protein